MSTNGSFPFPRTDPLTTDDLKLFGFALAVLVVTILLSRVMSSRLRSALELGGFQSNVAILLARALWVVVWAVGILLVLNRLGTGLTPLAAFIGVVGLAASLSLQQVLQNLVAGVYLLAERPFNIGDFIAVVGPAGLNHEGTVQDIQMRTTQLRNTEDELVLVPNSAIFAGVVTNRTAVGGIGAHLQLTFPRGSDPQLVRRDIVVVLGGLRSVKSVPTPQIRIEQIAEETWTGTLRFWLGTGESTSEAVWAIAQAFPEVTVNNGVPAA